MKLHHTATKVMHHGIAGDLELTGEALHLPGDPDLTTSPLITVGGMSGVGKTSLAVRGQIVLGLPTPAVRPRGHVVL